ncbi:MAG: hypothetical protein H6618_07355 [Deltaproteobacteria bacterium]|nr:hypothetical protein [Deltaproteobacteria bacterium]
MKPIHAAVSDKIKKDIQHLDKQFYTHLDESFLQTVFRTLLYGNHSADRVKISMEGHKLGAGRWFESYRISPPGPGKNDHYHYALSIPNRYNVLTSENTIYYRNWLRYMQKIDQFSERIVLFPPFFLLSEREASAWVTPLGEDREDLSLSSGHWQEERPTLIKEMQKTLQKIKLTLAPPYQIKAWHKIPFIHDLSDIRPSH